MKLLKILGFILLTFISFIILGSFLVVVNLNLQNTNLPLILTGVGIWVVFLYLVGIYLFKFGLYFQSEPCIPAIAVRKEFAVKSASKVDGKENAFNLELENGITLLIEGDCLKERNFPNTSFTGSFDAQGKLIYIEAEGNYLKPS